MGQDGLYQSQQTFMQIKDGCKGHLEFTKASDGKKIQQQLFGTILAATVLSGTGVVCWQQQLVAM
jgi:hypothetical protein